jgi:hypothetical protein
MTILNLVFRYFTDSSFKKYIDSIMALANNKNGVADKIEQELENYKKKVETRLSGRVNELTDVISGMRSLGVPPMLMSKLNNLLNELKEDLRDLD